MTPVGHAFIYQDICWLMTRGPLVSLEQLCTYIAGVPFRTSHKYAFV